MFGESKYPHAHFNIALSRLESLLKHADDIPVVFHKAINKIVENFEKINTIKVELIQV